jgi:hypothetical protein
MDEKPSEANVRGCTPHTPFRFAPRTLTRLGAPLDDASAIGSLDARSDDLNYAGRAVFATSTGQGDVV